MAKRQNKSPKPPERKMFMSISALGMVDENNKLVYSRSYKRLIADKDKPLSLLADIGAELIIPIIGYSSPEAADSDLKEFKKWANDLELVSLSEEKAVSDGKA